LRPEHEKSDIALHFFVNTSLNFAAIAMSTGPILGGITQLEGDRRKEALDLLNATLTQLAAGDGPIYK